MGEALGAAKKAKLRVQIGNRRNFKISTYLTFWKDRETSLENSGVRHSSNSSLVPNQTIIGQRVGKYI